MPETWLISEDKRSGTVSGRVKQPLRRKLNPFWWFGNDEEPWPPSDLYVGYPGWLRVVLWYLRNPLQNFGKYVVGVYDRNYMVIGEAPVIATTWLDDPTTTDRRGFKTSTIHLQSGIKLPFVSYTGKRVLWYAGWQWWGFFGFKINLIDTNAPKRKPRYPAGLSPLMRS